MGIKMAGPWQREKGSPYYLRMRIPADLVETLRGKKVTFNVAGELAEVKLGAEIKISLRTAEAALVKERYAATMAEVQDLFSRFRALKGQEAAPLTPKQIEGLAGEFYRDMCARYEHDPTSSCEEWQIAIELAEERQGSYRALEKALGHHLDGYLGRNALMADPISRRALLEAFNRASARLAVFQRRRAEGDYSPDQNVGKFPAWSNERPSPPANVNGVTLTQLFDLWESEHLRENGSPRTPAAYKSCLKRFISDIGHEVAERISPREVSDWAEALMTGVEPLSSKTVKAKYLVAIKTLYETGIRRQILSQNPAKGVQPKVRKMPTVRDKGFSDAEATKILTSALEFRETHQSHSELRKRAIQWGPWIAAHTGARIAEVMQLRKQDFYVQDGIPCLRITPEAGSVKTGEFRVIPIHKQLVELGLLAFVESCPEEYLFIQPSAELSETHQRAGRAGNHVSSWVRETVGITDPNVQPNHAWRHRFKTIARELGEERLADVIQGHSDGRASSGYGSHTVKAMNVLIAKMPGFRVDTIAQD